MGGKIEILCNNAGVPPCAGLELNLKVMAFGANWGVKVAVDRMSRSKGGLGGRIITTASAAGILVNQNTGLLKKGKDFLDSLYV